MHGLGAERAWSRHEGGDRPGPGTDGLGRAEEDAVAPDASGLDFFADDVSLQQILGLYLPQALRAHLWPHLARLGRLAGGRIDALARLADAHPPVLHHRDQRGRDRQWIEYHPAYRELERIGFSDFALAAMSHRAGVLGWPTPLPPLAKYAFTYLFAQAEFGLLCPISMTDALTRVLRRFADAGLLERYLPGLVSLEAAERLQGAMFVTEKAGGSDVGLGRTIARRQGDVWLIYGEKWFCSNADADLALLLARPEGAPEGTRGLGLFLLPRLLPDGTPNRYRIVRLKDKLGSRSMATGEVVLDGAVAWPVGDIGKGFRQMAEMINVSRLSNGVRSAGIMRRALREALEVARHRVAFGKPVLEQPLLRRQIAKLMVHAEQALSCFAFAAEALERADAGDASARPLLRVLTPMLKFRACRDARKAAGDAMEIRGGCGYVEEWVEPRLLRDAHLGSIWEGTSNIVALDAIGRAVVRHGGGEALRAALAARLDEAGGAPDALRARVAGLVDRAIALARRAGTDESGEAFVRQAVGGLYHATTAALMTWEGARLAAEAGDARRLLLAQAVVEHRLASRDPLDPWGTEGEARVAARLLDPSPVPLREAARLVGN